MVTVPLGSDAYERLYGREPVVQLINRFVERTPTNQIEGTSLLARPGTTFETRQGSGPVRFIDTQQGAFAGDLFYVSGDQLYRYDGDTNLAINGAFANEGRLSGAFVSGAGFEFLFIADGSTLQYYEGISAATGLLTASGDILDNDTVAIDNVHYQWVSGSVDTGTPDGTMGAPFLVALGTTNEITLRNLRQALNGTGVGGTTYTTNLTQHTTVRGQSSDDTTLRVAARERGTGGNSITITETGANIAWGTATLEGGGSHTLRGVPVPDDQAIVAVETLASFVVAVVSNSQRFYWIRPGETTIEPLDFAEAESEPDEINDVVRVGDALYMLGQSSTEVWYANPNQQSVLAPGGAASPTFIPQQGLAFSQGAIQGTAVRIRNRLLVVAEDGRVYIIGQNEAVSNHGIEERIRLARRALQQGS